MFRSNIYCILQKKHLYSLHFSLVMISVYKCYLNCVIVVFHQVTPNTGENLEYDFSRRGEKISFDYEKLTVSSGKTKPQINLQAVRQGALN